MRATLSERALKRSGALRVVPPALDGARDAGSGGERRAPAGPALSATDLAELVASFTEVTARLEATHDALRAEVARLERELREANDQLRRSESLAALGEMAAGIAHEVRNPLAAVALHARLLEADVAPGAPRETVRKIASAVRAADAVVTDVLAFARESRVRAEPIPALALLADAADASRPLFAQHGGIALALGSGARGARTARALADASLVRQALVNVIRNAAEAIVEAARGGVVRGEITLDAARRSTLGADGRRRRMVALTVRDTGPGVPPEALRRVFNPFFTTRAAGTGLGLAIVHRIVDAHGGRVNVRNGAPAPGGPGGAIVEILLPEANGTETGDTTP